MIDSFGDWFSGLRSSLEGISVTDSKGGSVPSNDGMRRAVSQISEIGSGKIIFIGNGASATIASHMATDFWKNAGVAAVSFNDSSLLTCISNDFGYKHVFEKPIQFFGRSEDILIAISSSGQSENILRAVSAAQELDMYTITLSGHRTENALRKLGGLNFYVPSMIYGFVEVAHHAICHYIVDSLCSGNGGCTKESNSSQALSRQTIQEISAIGKIAPVEAALELKGGDDSAEDAR